MRNTKVALVGAIMLLCFGGLTRSRAEEVYRWTDERGVIHFTDNYQNVPERYRPEASHEGLETTTTPQSSSSQGSAGRMEAPVVVNYYAKGSTILVQGLVNWKLPALFHLDTGATISAITQEDAQALGIPYENAPRIRTKLADGRIASLPRVVLSSVKVGDAEVTGIDAIISDVRLLGLNFLSHYRVTVDAHNGQVILAREKKEALKESESIQQEKKLTAEELETRIQQVDLAIRDLEKIIQQRESNVRLLLKKRTDAEEHLSHVRQQQPSSQRDALLAEGEERLRMIRLAIERENLAIQNHQKEITIHRTTIDHYRDLVSRLR